MSALAYQEWYLTDDSLLSGKRSSTSPT